MSKTTLRNALRDLDKDQIAEMVLDLYSARPEAKEYLDFWVSGDIDAKMHKAKAAIAKEAARTQRRHARPRMTKIKRYIKDITSLNADSQAIAEIMAYAVSRICAVGSDSWLKESTQKSAARLLHDTLVYAHTHGELPVTGPQLRDDIDSMRTDTWWARDFHTLMEEELNDTVASFAPPLP